MSSNTEIRLKVSMGHGRLYVAGPSHGMARRVRGAVFHEKRGAYELSLTLETLKALREATGLTYDEFKAFCTADVLTWARTAAESERRVAEAQQKIAAGWRPEGLTWEDARAGTEAPAGAPAAQATMWFDGDGQRRNSWKYRAPYEHQQIMAALGILLDGSANLSQMGTGKTRALCEVMRYRLERDEVDLCVVVAPKGVVGTWFREAPIWNPNFRILRLGHREGRITEEPVSVRKQHLRMLYDDPKMRMQKNVVLINYDILHLIEEELVALCKHLRVMLVADEMHRVANPSAKVTKTFMRLAQLCTYRIGATGTPLKDRTGEGIWSQWYVIDHGITFGANYRQFLTEWMDENPWTHARTPKPWALEEMGQRIARRSVRFLKADCMDLPDKVKLVREVTLTPEQRRVYDAMKEDLLATIGAEDDERVAEAATQISALLRLSQITSGFVPTDDGQLHFFDPNPKLDAVREIVDENIDQQQIVIWAHFRADHDMLMQALKAYNPVLLRGGLTPVQQDAIEQRFQRGEARLLIGQQQAAGVGRNFQAGSLVVYYSQRYSIVDREQSEDRTHRGGSEIHEKITYIDLVAQGTIDEDVARGLAEKREVQQVVVDMKRRLRGW